MVHLEKGVQRDILGVPVMHLCLVFKIMSNLRKLTRKFWNPQEVPRNYDVTDDSDWVSAFLVL